MNCDECNVPMVLEFARNGVEVWVCPMCGGADEFDLCSCPCYDEVVLMKSGDRS